MSDKNIYQRINEVRKAVEYVQKDAEVQGYKAVTHDMVTAVLRPHMVAQGIVVRVEQLTSNMLQQKVPKGDKGHNMHLYSGDYAIHFVNADSPDDTFAVTVNAHANDNGDKAPGKCASYAVKVALLKTFSLETGENDEQRFSDPYTPEQEAVFHELLDTQKAYEYYLFMKSIPHETQTGLVNSFPDGKKSQGKKAAAKLEADGLVLFQEVVVDVQGRLANHDISVLEISDEMTAIEKQLLASRLSKSEVAQLGKIKEASL